MSSYSIIPNPDYFSDPKDKFMIQFSYKKNILKGVKVFILILIPWLIDQFIITYPAIAQMTVSALLYMFMNWLKVAVGMYLP